MFIYITKLQEYLHLHLISYENLIYLALYCLKKQKELYRCYRRQIHDSLNSGCKSFWYATNIQVKES